ncbi:MAG: tripartite tricarboxylate transporter substrate binding protein [Betaproteobacteria bacterium]
MPKSLNRPARVWIKRSAFVLLGTGGACAAAEPVDVYPSRPLRFVVGFTPGGGSDLVARLLGQKLTENLGQPVVVDNRPGAGGNLANEIVVKAAPDAYSVLIASSSFTIQPAIYNNLSYKPQIDFAPVVLASSSPYLLVVHPSVPAQSVKELIVLAKAQPGKLNYASAGAGSALHLASELFKSMAGVDIVHVPYKGSNGIPDLIAGAVQVTIAGPPQTMVHVRAGRLRALAVTSSKRAAIAPQLPTIAEAGVPGYEVDSWYGALLPAASPRVRVEKLAAEINRALASTDLREKLLAQGLEPRGGSSAEFAAVIRGDIAKWTKVVADAWIRAD